MRFKWMCSIILSVGCLFFSPLLKADSQSVNEKTSDASQPSISAPKVIVSPPEGDNTPSDEECRQLMARYGRAERNRDPSLPTVPSRDARFRYCSERVEQLNRDRDEHTQECQGVRVRLASAVFRQEERTQCFSRMDELRQRLDNLRQEEARVIANYNNASWWDLLLSGRQVYATHLAAIRMGQNEITSQINALPCANPASLDFKNEICALHQQYVNQCADVQDYSLPQDIRDVCADLKS